MTFWKNWNLNIPNFWDPSIQTLWRQIMRIHMSNTHRTLAIVCSNWLIVGWSKHIILKHIISLYIIIFTSIFVHIIWNCSLQVQLFERGHPIPLAPAPVRLATPWPWPSAKPWPPGAKQPTLGSGVRPRVSRSWSIFDECRYWFRFNNDGRWS